MLTDETRRAFEEHKIRHHGLSYLKPINLLYLLTPITLRYWVWKFEKETIAYQDIYVFGFRIIRRQLFWEIP